MGRKRKAKNGICPHCNIKLESENGDNGEITEYWLECSKCGRSYDDVTGKDITEYDCWCDYSEKGKCYHSDSQGQLKCNGSDKEKDKCMEYNEEE